MTFSWSEVAQDLVRFQDGVIDRGQALDLGIPPDGIDRLVRDGQWQRLRRGVYLTRPGEPSRSADLWAAVRYAGPGAALSHHTAAELFKITDRRESAVHLTIPIERRVSRAAGLVIHRSSRVADIIHPALQPARTRAEETVLDLVDLASAFDEALGVVGAACQRGVTTTERLADAMARRKKLRWRNKLTEALGDVSAGVHSLLEYRYLHFVERPHGLPTAVRQAKVSDGGRNRYLDNLYRDYRLCVELDGAAAHPEHQRWQDLRRINKFTELGFITLRYGWVDIDRQPCETTVQIAAVLRQQGWAGSARACAPACAVRHGPAR